MSKSLLERNIQLWKHRERETPWFKEQAATVVIVILEKIGIHRMISTARD